jgi:hypothetical protein
MAFGSGLTKLKLQILFGEQGFESLFTHFLRFLTRLSMETALFNGYDVPIIKRHLLMAPGAHRKVVFMD